MKRKQPKLKFVNLHGHTCYSIFDGLGYPADHMDFAYENGLDALAITDHGHMNAFAQQFFHWQKMKEEGREFKAIFGVEAYFVPSIKEWEEMKNSDGGADDDKETSATIIEDEETKKATAREINRRSHLVLLAQNQKGLNNLFQLVSKSYERPNYYRFPRVDLEMLREHSEGVVATSACLTADSLLETNLGQMTMSEVVDKWKEGEEIFVLSYSEVTGKVDHKKVLWGDMTREKAKIIKIKLRDGKELRLTPDHKVFTDKGWMEAGNLKKHKGIKILSLK